jgi:hypothetical protein
MTVTIPGHPRVRTMRERGGCHKNYGRLGVSVGLMSHCTGEGAMGVSAGANHVSQVQNLPNLGQVL